MLGSDLARVLDALRTAHEGGHVLLRDQVAVAVARLGAYRHRHTGRALAHPDGRRDRLELHARLDRLVEVEVLLAVENRAEQLGRIVAEELAQPYAGRRRLLAAFAGQPQGVVGLPLVHRVVGVSLRFPVSDKDDAPWSNHPPTLFGHRRAG